MKILFFGTGDFGIPILKFLKEQKTDLTLVTNPARKKGRGRVEDLGRIHHAALEMGIPVVCEENIKDKAFIDKLADLVPDIIMVVDYGRIIPPGIIKLARIRAMNIHPSLLPKYRGASPIQSVLLNGDPLTGVTLQTLSEQVDAGEIVLQQESGIDSEDNFLTLETRLSALAVDLVSKFLGNPAMTGKMQDKAAVTVCRKFGKDVFQIDWSEPAQVIRNKVRAFHTPQPGMRTLFRGFLMKLLDVSVISSTDTKVTPGVITRIEKNHFTVMTGEGSLIIKEVQPENKKVMKTADFINGYRPLEAERLGA